MSEISDAQIIELNEVSAAELAIALEAVTTASDIQFELVIEMIETVANAVDESELISKLGDIMDKYGEVHEAKMAHYEKLGNRVREVLGK